MPVLDGFAAAQKIRNFEKSNALPHMPIIALTAGIGKRTKSMFQAGMDDYLTKPFSLTELRKTIQLFDRSLNGEKRNGYEPKISPVKAKAIPSLLPDINPKVLNMKAINNIREVEQKTGHSLLPSILSGFTSQMHEKLEEITKNMEEGDTEKIYRTAHAIKSMSANIGAEKLSD